MKNKPMKLLYISAIFSLVFSLKGFCQQDVEQIPCEKIVIKCAQSQPKGHIIINSQLEYKTQVLNDSPHPDCPSYTMPQIDFDKYTLLGAVIATGGCSEPKIDHVVTKNIITNEIVFNFSSEQQGICLMLWTYEIWCLIPKVADTSKITFNITEK